MDDVIKASIRLLKARYAEEGFLLVGIFGSQARRDSKPGSDLDLLYRLTPLFFTQ